MTSVENFYWILYENLLKPAELDCWYYYPWGTQNSLSRFEFQPWHAQYQLNHVLFGFDQEPFFTDYLGKSYESGTWAEWSLNRYCKLLANSEISSIKKELCKKRDMLDWYFFYHGFAALHWYQDAKYIKQNAQIKTAFLSLNHNISTYRSYRISMLAMLLDMDIDVEKNMSFHCDTKRIENELNDEFSLLSDVSKQLIKDKLQSLTKLLPLHIDQAPINGNLSARFGYQDYTLWQQSLWHVVNETVFYQPKLHLTEKTFQPIVAQRPFVLVSAPGNLAYLRRYGFQTFDRWIDESYDNITDPDLRLQAIAKEIAKFAKMSVNQLRDVYHDMMPVLEYNKHHFFGEFHKIIVDELVDNFFQCIRIWNNGRDYSKSLPLSDNPEAIKKILLM